jgi:hypothetical protein
VQAYIRNTEPSTEAMHAGGYRTRVKRDGTQSVHINGIGWTSVAGTAKAGLI